MQKSDTNGLDILDLLHGHELEEVTIEHAMQERQRSSECARLINSSLSQQGVSYTPPSYEDFESTHQKIFRSSFAMSNGSALVQFALQAEAVNLWARNIDDPETIAASAEGLVFDASLYIPPKRHAWSPEREDGGIAKKTEGIWGVYLDVCKNYDDLGRLTPSAEIDTEIVGDLSSFSDLNLLFAVIADIIALQDIQYITEGRPVGSDRLLDPRKSIFKSHVWEGRNSGSNEIDVVLKIARETVRCAYSLSDDSLFGGIEHIRETCDYLSYIWVQGNNGRDFW